jgi:hypothetical protein
MRQWRGGGGFGGGNGAPGRGTLLHASQFLSRFLCRPVDGRAVRDKGRHLSLSLFRDAFWVSQSSAKKALMLYPQGEADPLVQGHRPRVEAPSRTMLGQPVSEGIPIEGRSTRGSS